MRSHIGKHACVYPHTLTGIPPTHFSLIMQVVTLSLNPLII
jgi:hypothetical protein